MDFSQEYIAMCQGAVELQQLWEPEPGDFFIQDHRGGTGFDRSIEKQIWPNEADWDTIQVVNFKSTADGWFHTIDVQTGMSSPMRFDEWFKSKTTWLPRQDQLQGFYTSRKFTTENDPKLFEELYEFATVIVDNISLDKVWLMFVMDKIYHKLWKDTKWNKTK